MMQLVWKQFHVYTTQTISTIVDKMHQIDANLVYTTQTISTIVDCYERAGGLTKSIRPKQFLLL